jgi:hypothetical protein
MSSETAKKADAVVSFWDAVVERQGRLLAHGDDRPLIVCQGDFDRFVVMAEEAIERHGEREDINPNPDTLRILGWRIEIDDSMPSLLPEETP